MAKSFKFAFEKVLAHRRMLEQEAQRVLNEALSILNRETRVLEEMRQKRHEAFESRFQRQVQGGTAGEALSQVHEYLKGQDLRIEGQVKRIQEFEKQVEELRSVLRQRAVDTKIIERLKERKQEEFRIEQNKLEQKRLDDMTMTRFRSKDATDEENGI